MLARNGKVEQMKIIFRFPSQLFSADTLSLLNASFEEDFCSSIQAGIAQYFDFSNMLLKDIEGGDIAVCKNEHGVHIDILFWSPGIPDEASQECLDKEVLAQVEDGYLEGGFEFEHNDQAVLAIVNTENNFTVTFFDDGREVLGANPLAIAIIEESFSLETIVNMPKEFVDRMYRGLTPLHWAVFKTDQLAVELLLKAGASPDASSNDETTPLMRLAYDNSATDEQCSDIGRILLAHNAAISESMVETAISRGKPLFARLLQSKGYY